MIDMLNPVDLNNDDIHKYIHQLENNKLTISRDVRDNEIVNKLMSLSQVYTFFDDLMKYHKNMDLPNSTIEKFVLDIDDMIDSYEEYADVEESANKLLNDYYTKAQSFYELLLNLQFELGFYLSDRKYQV
ncbi:MAG: hypothetical protein U9R39_03275 [Campylobacterota bacterium]|nr:hypothetical protein [Campylobacterota bacterium]